MGRKELFYYVTSESNVAQCVLTHVEKGSHTITCATIENGKLLSQANSWIHKRLW